MRLVLLLAVVGILLSSPAAAQIDEILLFSDAQHSDCTLFDKSPGPVSVYVVHRCGGDRASVQFKVEADAGVGLSYMGDTTPFQAVMGNTQNGILVAYGDCYYSDVLVVTINYFGSGTSSTCSTLRVVPDPNSPTGMIDVVNCSLMRLEASGSRLVINPDGSCECGPNAEKINWGKLKSKYHK